MQWHFWHAGAGGAKKTLFAAASPTHKIASAGDRKPGLGGAAGSASARAERERADGLQAQLEQAQSALAQQVRTALDAERSAWAQERAALQAAAAGGGDGGGGEESASVAEAMGRLDARAVSELDALLTRALQDVKTSALQASQEARRRVGLVQ